MPRAHWVLRAAAWALLLSCLGGTGSARAEPVTLDLVVYNTALLTGKRAPMERARAIARILPQYDVSLLQETFLNRPLQVLRDGLSAQHVVDTGEGTRVATHAGMMVASRFPVAMSVFERFEHCGGVDCYAAKGILYSRLVVRDDVELDVFVLHANSDRTRSYHRARAKQFLQLREMISRYADGSRPVVVAGDFNVVAGTDEYDALVQRMNGFDDAWTEAEGEEGGWTYHPDNTMAPSRYPPMRIDYAFVRGGRDTDLHVVGADVVFDEPIVKKRLYPSDHFGVAVTLRLSPLGADNAARQAAVEPASGQTEHAGDALP